MFLFKRRWLPTTLLVIIASLVMIRLGFWQLDRLEQKRAYIVQVQAELDAPPIPLTGDETDLDARARRHRRAVVEGRYDFERQVIIKSKLYQRRPGYHLLTPFRIEGSERALLVDRGWIPAAEDLTDLSRFDEPGVTRIEGRIQPEDRRPEAAQWPTEPQKEWYRIDIAGIQNQTPYPLLPFYLALTPTENDPELPHRNPPEIILDEGPHLGYAIQWFLFALIVPVVYAFQVRRMDRESKQTE
ncbi:MAG: SURF1 family protein [Chloroflexi bacterium]|nr:SURF1 family protein [Chloroflexota bacterium]